MAVETESFTAGDGTDITSVGSSIWAYTNGVSGDLFVTSNAIRPRLNKNNLMLARRAGTFADDQYAQIVITAMPSGVNTRIGVGVRCNTSGTGYYLYVQSGTYLLAKLVSYSATQLRLGGGTFAVNDVIRLEAEGTTLRAIKNGTTFWTATDSAIASGNPGVSANGEDASQFAAGDDWEGGDLVTAAPQFYQYDWPHQLHARR